LRHNQYYDPELSLVAVSDGRIVGHAFFSPFEFLVLGQKRRGVYLAPLGVDTACQHQGVGSRLLEAGHTLARSKGYFLSLLCGHPGYYPRFGYQPRAFSLSGAKIDMRTVKVAPSGIIERPVTVSDLPWMIRKWREMHEYDRLAWFPGDRISQWMNHSLMYRSSVFLLGDRVIGYAKYKTDHPIRVTELLPEAGCAPAILAHIADRTPAASGQLLLSMTAEALGPMLEGSGIRIERSVRTSDSLFLKILDPDDDALRRYCEEAGADERNLGILAFPALLDIDN